MARTGNAHSVKRVRPQLTTIQKSAHREKFVSLTNDINDTRAAYMDEVQGLAKKHGRYVYYRAILTIISIHYQIRALDTTSVIPWRENCPSSAHSKCMEWVRSSVLERYKRRYVYSVYSLASRINTM
jgi:hypothetical protein